MGDVRRHDLDHHRDLPGAAGFGIFSGNILARTVGVFAALGSMISMFLWLPWYPVWAIIIISMDIAIIWALTVHGRVLSRDA